MASTLASRIYFFIFNLTYFPIVDLLLLIPLASVYYLFLTLKFLTFPKADYTELLQSPLYLPCIRKRSYHQIGCQIFFEHLLGSLLYIGCHGCCYHTQPSISYIVHTICVLCGKNIVSRCRPKRSGPRTPNQSPYHQIHGN